VSAAILAPPTPTKLTPSPSRAVAAEFLQEHCNGPEIAKAAGALLDDPVARAAQVAAQTAALAKLGLGYGDPFDRAAQVVVDLARERRLPGAA
jgi:lipid-A-disaccharide synthase